MANSNSRSNQARDPLAELARLIGQGQASGGQSRDAREPVRARAPAARDAEWTPETRFAQEDEARYAVPRPPAAPVPRPAQDRAYQNPGFQDHDDEAYSSDQGYSNDQRYQNGQGYPNPQGYQDDRYSQHEDPRGYRDDSRDLQQQDLQHQDLQHQDLQHQDLQHQDLQHQDLQHQGYQQPDYQRQDYGRQDYQRQDYQRQEHQHQDYQPRNYQPQDYQNQGYQQAHQGHQDHGYQDAGYEEPAGSRFFSGQAGQFNGFRDEPEQGMQHDPEEGPPSLPAARGLATFRTGPDGHGYETDQQPYAEGEASLADQEYQETRRPRRRTGLVAVMAVFALMVVGTAGAFGYRAMFGGSVLPSLPPIIRASAGPNKIAPDPQGAANAAQAATTGSPESLVSREEQPVAIDPAKPGAHVVSTVPISPDGQNQAPPGMSGLPPANQIATAGVGWPASAAAAAPAPASPPPAQTGEPKKIHTVTIRSDQTGSVPDNGGAAAAKARTNAAPKTTAAIPAGGAGPMSIVPGQGGDAAAPAPTPRTRTASLPPGGSFVQLTSRRSEGEAQTEFRALQAKFPSQLNGREAVIRRADLGEKGVYYRALVGPFGSAEEAAQLCSGLKAAGGNCIVQK